MAAPSNAMKPLIALALLAPALAFGQAADLRVSLDARGDDVREVFATLFAQADKPYALDASIKGKLYVKLDRMPFAKALSIVLTQAGLKATVKDGVTMIVPAPKPVPVATPKIAAPKPLGPPAPAKPLVAPAKPTPTLSPTVLKHIVTTRSTKAPLADVFAELGEQAKVTIELDPKVPAYRVDAFFIKTSLRYALDRVCKAANLTYKLEDGKIVVSMRTMDE